LSERAFLLANQQETRRSTNRREGQGSVLPPPLSTLSTLSTFITLSMASTVVGVRAEEGREKQIRNRRDPKKVINVIMPGGQGRGV
jgi:hypothetical protein